MRKVTVQRAYTSAGRVLVDNDGRVYAGIDWTESRGPVHRVGETYERWVDVPFAWLGYVPYWSNRR